MVREVLGDIDLDPATEPAAQERIRAKHCLGAKGELSETVWLSEPGSVFCNPPGGKKGNKSMTGLFWRRLMEERDKGLLTHAVFLCFSIEALQHTQNLACLSVGRFPLCVPRRRVAFDYPDGSPGGAPSHSNVIVYVPGTVDKRDTFADVFDSLGAVLNLRG